jgi:hypothetical protein
MLKIWKQAWKREESRRPQLAQDGDKEGQSSGTGNEPDAPHPNVTAEVSQNPKDPHLISVVPSHDQNRFKRARTNHDSASSSSDDADWPAKRARAAIAHDSLRSDLPGNDSPKSRDTAHTSWLLGANLEDQILEQAKRENSKVSFSFMGLKCTHHTMYKLSLFCRPSDVCSTSSFDFFCLQSFF